jgi:hypothetical protein
MLSSIPNQRAIEPAQSENTRNTRRVKCPLLLLSLSFFFAAFVSGVQFTSCISDCNYSVGWSLGWNATFKAARSTLPNLDPFMNENILAWLVVRHIAQVGWLADFIIFCLWLCVWF